MQSVRRRRPVRAPLVLADASAPDAHEAEPGFEPPEGERDGFTVAPETVRPGAHLRPLPSRRAPEPDRDEAARGRDDGGAEPVAESHLTPALRAAAAARAAAARIRAGRRGGPGEAPDTFVSVASAPTGDLAPAAPAAAEPAGNGHVASEPAAEADAPAPCQGLSVTEASAASAVTFRPLARRPQPQAPHLDTPPPDPAPAASLTETPAPPPAEPGPGGRFARTMAQAERQRREADAPDCWALTPPAERPAEVADSRWYRLSRLLLFS